MGSCALNLGSPHGHERNMLHVVNLAQGGDGQDMENQDCSYWNLIVMPFLAFSNL